MPLRGAVLVIFDGEYDVVSRSVYFEMFCRVTVDSIGVAKSIFGKPYFRQIALGRRDCENVGFTGVVSDIIGLRWRTLVWASGVDGVVWAEYDENDILCIGGLYGTLGAVDDGALRVVCNVGSSSSTFILDWSNIDGCDEVGCDEVGCDDVGCDEDGCGDLVADNICCIFLSKSCLDWCAFTSASTVFGYVYMLV